MAPKRPRFRFMLSLPPIALELTSDVRLTRVVRDWAQLGWLPLLPLVLGHWHCLVSDGRLWIWAPGDWMRPQVVLLGR